MNQHKHLGVLQVTQCYAAKVANENLDRHLHAMNGTTHHNAFAMQLHSAHTTVRAEIVRLKADWQRERVEPQGAARPGGIDPACCCLTPQGLYPPPGLCSRSMRETLPKPVA
jgi:hypothetical protein